MGGREGGARQRRRFSSAAEGRDTEHVDAGLGLLFWDYFTYPLKDFHWRTVTSVCCVYVSVI